MKHFIQLTTGTMFLLEQPLETYRQLNLNNPVVLYGSLYNIPVAYKGNRKDSPVYNLKLDQAAISAQWDEKDDEVVQEEKKWDKVIEDIRKRIEKEIESDKTKKENTKPDPSKPYERIIKDWEQITPRANPFNPIPPHIWEPKSPTPKPWDVRYKYNAHGVPQVVDNGFIEVNYSKLKDLKPEDFDGVFQDFKGVGKLMGYPWTEDRPELDDPKNVYEAKNLENEQNQE